MALGLAGDFEVVERSVGRGLWRRLGGLCAAVVMAATLFSGGRAEAAGTRVILLRGWFGVFSTGLDTIADQLKANGIKAEVVAHLDWSRKANEVLTEMARGQGGALVLIGHSQGANNVIDIAKALQANNVSVDLLITLSPFMQNPVPANVSKAINFYKSPGWGAPLESEAGLSGNILNINLSDDPTILHVSIDKNSRIQGEIVREILALDRSYASRGSVTTALGMPTNR